PEDAANSKFPLAPNAMRYTKMIPRNVKARSLVDDRSRGTRLSNTLSDQGNINVMRNGNEYMKNRVGIYRYGALSQAITCSTTQTTKNPISRTAPPLRSSFSTDFIPRQTTTRTMKPMIASTNSTVI